MATATAMPRRVRDTITEIASSPDMRAGLEVAAERRDDYRDLTRTKLAGIANHPAARAHFDRRLDEWWEEARATDADEVVIGAGLHGAIYASVRAAAGYPRPLLVDAGRIGGTFAVSDGPSFYLNSRNRPGGLGIPGEAEAALNVVPCAPLQPADLSSTEYQRDSDLGFVVRSAIAMHATARGWSPVEAVAEGGGTRRFRVLLEGGGSLTADRVVVATGIGAERTWGVDSDRVVTFSGLMRRMGSGHWPLRGLRRVAVIGAGDSGRCAVEALVGQGPAAGMSAASLDFVERIDWYGLLQTNREEWERANRSRYKGIGRLLPCEDDATGFRRLVPAGTAQEVAGGYECAYVDGRPYDLVVDCRGFERPASPMFGTDWALGELEVDGLRLGLRADGREAYVVGPAAALDLSGAEEGALPEGVPENTAALFRYAGRTAQLARTLGPPPPPPPPPAKVPFDSKAWSGLRDAVVPPLREDRPSVGCTDGTGADLREGDKVKTSRGLTGTVLGYDGVYVLLGGVVGSDGASYPGTGNWKGRPAFKTRSQGVTLVGRRDVGPAYLPALGIDSRGRTILPGALVRRDRGGAYRNGIMLGPVETDRAGLPADSARLGVLVTEANGAPPVEGDQGGYLIRGVRVWGEVASEWTVLEEPTALGADAAGRPLFRGQRLRTTDAGSTYEGFALGIVTSRRDRSALLDGEETRRVGVYVDTVAGSRIAPGDRGDYRVGDVLVWGLAPARWVIVG